MQRRAFVLIAAGGLASGLPTLATADANAGETAAARIGARILTTLSLPMIEALRRDHPDAAASMSDALRRRIAADHRAGRIIKVDGVNLAVSEAVWCVAQAESVTA